MLIGLPLFSLLIAAVAAAGSISAAASHPARPSLRLARYFASQRRAGLVDLAGPEEELTDCRAGGECDCSRFANRESEEYVCPQC